jgi:hypothetical protein
MPAPLRSRAGRAGRVAVVALAAAAALAACGPPPPAADAVTPDDAVVYIKTNVADADLYVDGKLVGRIGFLRGGIAVVAGTHHLELRHGDDYFPTYREIKLARAERRRVDMNLWAILP